MSVRLTTLAAFAALIVARGAGAQWWTNSWAEPQVFASSHRLLYEGQVLEQSGLWLGGRVGIRIGRVGAEIAGAFGSLSGDDASNPERAVRASSIALQTFPTDWLTASLVAEACRFESDAATQLWRLVGPRLDLHVPLGAPMVSGTAVLAVYPLALSSGSTDMSFALRSEFGATVLVRRAVQLGIAYRFERFDFAAPAAAGGSARLEQLAGLVLSARIQPWH